MLALSEKDAKRIAGTHPRVLRGKAVYTAGENRRFTHRLGLARNGLQKVQAPSQGDPEAEKDVDFGFPDF